MRELYMTAALGEIMDLDSSEVSLSQSIAVL